MIGGPDAVATGPLRASSPLHSLEFWFTLPQEARELRLRPTWA